MKRYYVNHFSGMNSDAEFEEVRGRIIQEGLIDPEGGRDRRRVRWPGSRFTDQTFLHLWASREEAEAFVSRLRRNDQDRRWKVFEVDVEGSIEEILDPNNLHLPDSPKVVSIRSEPYVDSLGEEALQVRVVVEDKPSGGLYEWPEVQEIHQAIHDTLSAEGVAYYPYVEFLTNSEEAEQPQDA